MRPYELSTGCVCRRGQIMHVGVGSTNPQMSTTLRSSLWGVTFGEGKLALGDTIGSNRRNSPAAARIEIAEAAPLRIPGCRIGCGAPRLRRVFERAELWFGSRVALSPSDTDIAAIGFQITQPTDLDPARSPHPVAARARAGNSLASGSSASSTNRSTDNIAPPVSFALLRFQIEHFAGADFTLVIDEAITAHPDVVMPWQIGHQVAPRSSSQRIFTYLFGSRRSPGSPRRASGPSRRSPRNQSPAPGCTCWWRRLPARRPHRPAINNVAS